MYSFLSDLVLAHLFFGCVFYVAYSLCLRWLSGAPSLVRWCGVYILGCWILGLLFHALRACGAFSPMPAVAAALVLAGAVRLFRGREAGVLSSLRSDARAAASRLSWPEDASLATATFCFLFVALLLLVRVFLLPPLGWDAFTYHGLKAGIWIQSGGRISYDAPGAWEYYRSFFGGGEVYTAWFMLSQHSFTFAAIPDWIHWLFLGAIIAALAAHFGLTDRSAFLTAACFLVTFDLMENVGTGNVDVGLNAALLGGLLFLLRSFESKRGSEAFFAGAALGVAGSIKVTGFIIGLVVIGLYLVISGGRPKRGGGNRVLLLAGAFLLPVLPWMAINYLTVGYPLGCVPGAIGPLRLGRMPRSLEWFLDRPDLHPYRFSAETVALWESLKRYGLSLLLPLLAVPGLVSAVKRRPRRTFLALTLAAGTAAVYFSPSFAVVRLSFTWLNGRFLLPCLVVPAVIGLSRFDRTRRGSVLLEMVVVISMIGAATSYWFAYVQQAPPPEQEAVMSGLAAAFLVGALLMRVRARLFEGRPPFLWITFVCLIWLTALLASEMTAGNMYLSAYHGIGSKRVSGYWMNALDIIEEDSERNVIAVTYGPSQTQSVSPVAPFLGRDLRNQVLYVSPERNGRVIPHHPAFLSSSDPDVHEWLARLKARGVTHVLCFRPPPRELSWMEEHEESFTRLAGEDDSWGLFRFIPEGDSR